MRDEGQPPATASDVDPLAVKRRHQDRLLALPGVCGLALARDSAGNPILQIHVRSDQPRPPLPKAVEGLAIEVRESGPFRPFAMVPPS